jgi:hypothetical protein
LVIGVILANLEIFYQQNGYVHHLGQFFLKTQQHKQMLCFVTWVGCHIKGHAIDHEYAKL